MSVQLKGKSYIDTGRLGILNSAGDLWTSETFRERQEADAYVAAFWRGVNVRPPVHYSVVPVRVTVTPIKRVKEPA